MCARDVHGKELCLPQAAQRVVSLAPHATELLYAAGAENQVVGVMSGSDYPEDAKTKPIVGDYQSVSLETIISLQPDLVVVWPSGNPIGIAEQLNRFDIPVYFSDPVSVADITHDLQALGQLSGNSGYAAERAAELVKKQAALTKKYSGRVPVKTLLMISDIPMMGLSNSHAVVEAFQICGAVNALAGITAKAPLIGRESLLLMQPQLIITTYPVSDSNIWLIERGFVAPPQPAQASVDPDLMLRQTPRMLSAIEQFCEHVDRVRPALREATGR